MSLPTGPRRTPPPKERRLSALKLAEFTGDFDAATQKLIRTLRQTVLRTVPHAVEAIRFRTLCYFDPDITWGALGGNICLIEAKPATARKPARVFLTFIFGTSIPDPRRLLTGSGKFKRFLPIPDQAAAKSPATIALLKASARYTASRASE